MNINTKMTNNNVKRSISPKISKKYITKFFPETIRNLRLLFHYKQEFLANYLNISLNEYRCYEICNELKEQYLINKLKILYDL